MRILNSKSWAIIALLFAVVACREDEYVTYLQQEALPNTSSPQGVTGLYLLNEGNMGSNKCTLDYLEFCGSDSASHYYRNIYGQRNPNTIMELGDVGNDIAIYGSKLWIVVNCSNKVEVCHASTTQRIGQIDIANCRYLAFDSCYAYISSYAGPIQSGDNSPLGRVYKVDTLTLQKIDSLTVGYQPEAMAISAGKLYVANSGGYRAPQYDNRLTVIDLCTFRVDCEIPVGINLHHVVADRYNQLWVSSRGDYDKTPASLFWLKDNVVKGNLDLPVSTMTLVGDSLYYLGSTFSYSTGTYQRELGIIDVRTHQRITTSLFDAPEIQQMTLPYGIIVNPFKRDFYLMDAKNYVSSGELLHFTPDGQFDWRVRTGDIPSRAAWLYSDGVQPNHSSDSSSQSQSPYIQAVDEYCPAPGQFVNTLPRYEDGDNATLMAKKATDAIANNAGELITLGGWGGYVTFHFDHPVKNLVGAFDFRIFGNAILNGSEAGIVCVSQDTNGNHLPDDTWYELSGSADLDSTNVQYGYQLTYTQQGQLQDIPWTDNQGETGKISRNAFHSQEYFPLWLDSPLVFSGTRLPDNATHHGNEWSLSALRYGYVDNLPNNDADGNSFDIGWAVHPLTRAHIDLDHIDFIRVYTGLNQSAGWLGETSTEVSGAILLH